MIISSKAVAQISTGESYEPDISSIIETSSVLPSCITMMQYLQCMSDISTIHTVVQWYMDLFVYIYSYFCAHLLLLISQSKCRILSLSQAPLLPHSLLPVLTSVTVTLILISDTFVKWKKLQTINTVLNASTLVMSWRNGKKQIKFLLLSWEVKQFSHRAFPGP